mgnify:CR=1 FL=1
MSIISVDSISPRQSGVAVTATGSLDIDNDLQVSGVSTVGVLTVTDTVVSGASTFMGNVTMLGDLDVTGDITYDETNSVNVNVTGVTTSARFIGTDIQVSGASTFATGTFSSAVTVSATTDSITKDTGAVIIDGGIGIEKNLTLGTTVKVDATTGIVTATEFKGSGANLTGLPAGFDWLQGSLF